MRFRNEEGERPRFVHTLNATAVAVPRVILAILENHQQPDGSVRIPKALHPYMHGITSIPCRSRSLHK